MQSDRFPNRINDIDRPTTATSTATMIKKKQHKYTQSSVQCSRNTLRSLQFGTDSDSNYNVKSKHIFNSYTNIQTPLIVCFFIHTRICNSSISLLPFIIKCEFYCLYAMLSSSYGYKNINGRHYDFISLESRIIKTTRKKNKLCPSRQDAHRRRPINCHFKLLTLQFCLHKSRIRWTVGHLVSHEIDARPCQWFVCISIYTKRNVKIRNKI